VDRISFKGTVEAISQCTQAIAQARFQKKNRELVSVLLRVIARDQVPDRAGRSEHRAVERPPKPFPQLNKPRWWTGPSHGHFRTVCEYMHLNPARAKLLLAEQVVRDYASSSYLEYLKAPSQRWP
jgi:hypothetical protein